MSPVLTKPVKTLPESPAPKKAFLIPAQLSGLKSGPTVNVFVGCSGDMFIAIEGAFTKVLTQFSGHAKQKLVVEGASKLSLPGTDKEAITWIYKFMLSGEKVLASLTPLGAMSAADLTGIHVHAKRLEYPYLADQTMAQLKTKIDTARPQIEDIQMVKTHVPELVETAAHSVARLIVRPLTVDLTPYMQYLQSETEFGDLVDVAVDSLLKERIATSERYHGRWAPRARPTTPPLAGATKSIRSSPTGKPVNQNNLACFKCLQNGHFARDCVSPVKNQPANTRHANATHAGPPVAAINKATRDAQLPAKPSPTCFKCQKAGHISRYCRAP
ncbi:hypothetical protein BCR34DRAFT_299302, partial [Clohesyomyces aquaticus]